MWLISSSPPYLQCVLRVHLHVGMRVLVCLLAKAGQTSHRHLSSGFISQRPMRKMYCDGINIQGDSIPYDKCHLESGVPVLS